MSQNNSPSQKELRRSQQAEHRIADNKTVKHISTWIIGILAMVIIITGIMVFKYVETSLKPVNPESSKLIRVRIPKGSTSKDIAHILEKNRIIKSATVFNMYVKTNNISDFKAGSYDFKQSDTIKRISNKLQEGGRPLDAKDEIGKVVIPEGQNIAGIKKIVAKKTPISAQQLEKLLKDESFFNSLVKKYPALLTSAQEAKGVRYRLEGYLYPATYTVYEKMTAKDLVLAMVDKTNQVLTPYYVAIKNKGYTMQEFLTLASLVEKEGVTTKDRRMIAGVFMNRMDHKMPLQSDISVMYALNTHKTHLNNQDTSVDSPYNLYKNPGYGPGPFDSPSVNSIKAVLDPLARDENYLYFIADIKTKKVYYSHNYDEHLKKQNEIDN